MHFATAFQHQCSFCLKTFDNADAENVHILKHFIQETCAECNQTLIRIGSKLFVAHDTATCVHRAPICEKVIKPAKVSKRRKPAKKIRSSKLAREIRYDAEDGLLLRKKRYIPEVKVSGYEEILIKVEEEDEEENQVEVPPPQQQQQQLQQPGKIVEEVEVEVENEITDPEFIIIDFDGIPLVREQQTKQPESIPQPSPKQITKCDVCLMEFDCIFFLESHRKLKHPMATAKADDANVPAQQKGTKSIAKPKPTSKRSQQTGQGFQCLICYKLYKTENSLRHHIDTIHDPEARKYRCEVCGTAFFRDAALQNHIDNQHLDLKKFICDICHKGLKSKISLKRHMFQHNGKKPYKCTWEKCKKRFTTTANRDEHYRSHTGEKRFQCTVEGCNNRYTFAADIRKHLYKIHKIFPKKFPCELCKEVFPQRAMLTKHMKKHAKKR